MTAPSFCWVRYCENFRKPNPNISLYPAPYRTEDQLNWSKAFGIPIEKFCDKTRVCSLHFVHKNQLQLLAQTDTVQESNWANYLKTNTGLNTVENASDAVLCFSPHNPKMFPINNESVPPLESAAQKTENTNNSGGTAVSSMFCSMENLLSCNLFLDCQEDELTQVQLNFQNQEWLNYCKFNARIHNLPAARVEKELTCPTDVPFLVFSNAPQADDSQTFSQSQVPQSYAQGEVSQTFSQAQAPQFFQQALAPVTIPQTQAPQSFSQMQVPKTFQQLQVLQNFPKFSQQLIMPPVSSSGGQSQPYYQAPPANVPLSSAVNNLNSNILHLFNNQLVSVPKPSVIPMKLQQVEKEVNSSVINSPPQPTPANEEVFPLIMPETLSSVAVVDQTNNVDSSKPINICVAEMTPNSIERDPEPSFPDDSGSSRSLSPNPLSKVEVSLEESNIQFPSIVSELPTDASPLLTSVLTSNNSNGPKITGVLGGNAGAKEYYKDLKTPVNLNLFTGFSNKGESILQSNNTEAEKTMPKTVTQWSIFSMQKTIAVISSGSKEGNPRNLLRIRCSLPPHAASGDAATRLRSSLREGNFLTLSIWWLIQKQFLPLNPPCTACKSKVFRINSCYEFPDKLCWICDKCSLVFPVKRPKFLERFPQMCIEELMLLTYHWACKSQHQFLNKDLHIPDDLVFNYFCALQELCGNFINENCMLGKNPSSPLPSTVEISAVKLGKFFIICAFCRRTKLTRLKAITTDSACSTLAHIEAIKQMVSPNSIIISWKRIEPQFLPNMTTWSSDPALTNVLSTGRHILNASKYLGKTMVELFQNINHDHLDISIVQGYLDEVMWRDRFGRNEESAFWNIMTEMSRVNERNFTDAIFGDIGQDRFFYKQDINFQMRWGPFQFPPPNIISLGNVIEETVGKAISENVSNTTTKIRSTPFLPAVEEAPSTSKVATPPTVAESYNNIINTVPQRNLNRHPISFTSVVNSTSYFKEPTENISSKDMLSVKVVFNNSQKFQEALKNESMKLGNVKK